MNALELSQLSVEEAEHAVADAEARLTEILLEESAREQAIRREKTLNEHPPTPLAAAMPFHPDCRDCCAIGRCHFCLVQPAIGSLRATLNDYSFGACKNHWQRLVDTFADLQAVQGANTPQ